MNEGDRRSGLKRKRKRKEMNREKALTVLQEMRLGPGALSWQAVPLAGDAHPVSRSQARDFDNPLLDPCMHPIHTHPRPGCSNWTYANGQWQSSDDDDRSCRLQVCTYVSVHVQRQIITLLSSGR